MIEIYIIKKDFVGWPLKLIKDKKIIFFLSRNRNKVKKIFF
jgi:hypothetical protein